MQSSPQSQARKSWELRFCKTPLNTRSGAFGALYLRFMLSAFFWAHLYRKFFDVPLGGFQGWWHALNHNYPMYVPIYVLTVEFSCAILLPLGFCTRLVALYALPSMTGVVLFWLRIKGFWFTDPGAEFPLMWLGALVLQVILGDGAYAIKVLRTTAARA